MGSVLLLSCVCISKFKHCTLTQNPQMRPSPPGPPSQGPSPHPPPMMSTQPQVSTRFLAWPWQCSRWLYWTFPNQLFGVACAFCCGTWGARRRASVKMLLLWWDSHRFKPRTNRAKTCINRTRRLIRVLRFPHQLSVKFCLLFVEANESNFSSCLWKQMSLSKQHTEDKQWIGNNCPAFCKAPSHFRATLVIRKCLNGNEVRIVKWNLPSGGGSGATEWPSCLLFLLPLISHSPFPYPAALIVFGFFSVAVIDNHVRLIELQLLTCDRWTDFQAFARGSNCKLRLLKFDLVAYKFAKGRS